MDEATVVLRHSRPPRLSLFLASLTRKPLVLVAQLLHLPKPLRFVVARHARITFAGVCLDSEPPLLERLGFLRRALHLKGGKVTAVYGKHSFADFELATGKFLGAGSD